MPPELQVLSDTRLDIHLQSLKEEFPSGSNTRGQIAPRGIPYAESTEPIFFTQPVVTQVTRS